MAQPDILAILQEIAETERRIVELERSTHDTMTASHKVIVESRELIERVEQEQKRWAV